MSYATPRTKAKAKDVSIFHASARDVNGLGSLKPGTYTATVGSMHRHAIQFDVLPTGFHVENFENTIGLKVGDEVKLSIGLDKRGYMCRKNSKGEFAFVHPHDRDSPSAKWYGSIPEVVAANPGIIITTPVIGVIMKAGEIIYKNDNAYLESLT